MNPDVKHSTEEAQAITAARFECAVIRACLTRPDWIDRATAAGVGSDCFVSPIRGALWSIMLERTEAGEPITAMHVGTAARDRLALQGIGQAEVSEELSGIEKTVPKWDLLDDYVSTLVELAKDRERRQVFAAANRAMMDGDPKAAADFLTHRLDEIDARGTTADAGFVDFGAAYREAVEVAVGERQSRIIRTGFGGFDQICGGLEPGQLVVIAARTSIGKSTVAFNFACRFAIGDRNDPNRQNGKALFLSLETSEKPFARRVLAQVVKKSPNELKRPKSLDAHGLALAMDQAPVDIFEQLIFCKRRGIGVREMRSIIVDSVKRRGAKIAIVDYAGLVVERNNGGRETERDQLARVTQTLQSLAGSLDIPVVVLQQVNREAEKTPGGPKLHQIAASGTFEADADIVCLLDLHEDCKRGSRAQLVKFDVVKNRDGNTGVCWYAKDEFQELHEPPSFGSNPTPDLLRWMHEKNGTGIPLEKPQGSCIYPAAGIEKGVQSEF